MELTNNFYNYVFKNRSDAENFVSAIRDTLDRFDKATLGDIKDKIAITAEREDWNTVMYYKCDLPKIDPWRIIKYRVEMDDYMVCLPKIVHYDERISVIDKPKKNSRVREVEKVLTGKGSSDYRTACALEEIAITLALIYDKMEGDE